LAAPSPDDAAKITHLKEMANSYGQGYLKDTYASKNRALLIQPDQAAEACVEGLIKIPVPAEPNVYIAPQITKS
jgi:hypothetical protein